MKVRRVFVEGLDPSASEVQLSEDQSRYVARVLRMRVGDPLHVFDGRGTEIAGTLLSLSRNAVVVAMRAPVAAIAPSPCSITLIQGVSRGDRMDFTLQKATELGVYAVHICFSERSEVRLSGKRLQSRMEHWQGVVVSASEQCGRADVPEIHLLEGFPETTMPDTAHWILDGGSGRTLASVLKTQPMRDHCTVAVGPEGGWAQVEVDAALRAGWEPLGLGPRTLRSETAGPAAIAAIQAAWGDW